MSRRIAAAASTVCAAVALFAFIMSQNGDFTEPAPQNTAYTFSGNEKKEESAAYTLYVENGIIIIKGAGGQIIETGISTDRLRSYDRELLSEGIAVSTYDEVLMLLEDFNS